MIPIIKNWAISWGSNDPYMAPEMAGKVITGNIYCSDKFRDGDVIRTSLIKDANGRVVTTVTGSKYKLYGRPNKLYAKWIQENKINYNGRKPINIKQGRER